MCAQKTGAYFNRARTCAIMPGHAQHLQFRISQSRPYPDFTSISVTPSPINVSTRIEARQLQTELLLWLARVAVDGRYNPATGARYFFVTGSIQTQFEFCGTVSAKNHMGVTIESAQE